MKNNQIIKKFLHNKKREQKMTIPPIEEWCMGSFPAMLVSELADAGFRLPLVAQFYFNEDDNIYYEQLLRKYFHCFPETLHRTNIEEEVYVRQLFAIVAAAFDDSFDRNSQAAQNLFRIVREQKNILYNEILNSPSDSISYNNFSEKASGTEYHSIRDDSVERYHNSIVSFLFLAEMMRKTVVLTNFDIRNIEDIVQYVYYPNFDQHIPEDELEYLCWYLGLPNPRYINETTLIEYILSSYDEDEENLPPFEETDTFWDEDAKSTLLEHTIFYVKNTTRMYKLGDSPLLHQPITKKQLLNTFENFHNFDYFDDDFSSLFHQAERFIHYIVQELILDCLHQAKNEMVDMLFFD